jgi:quercetin dioxygenase-like cupin family protein
MKGQLIVSWDDPGEWIYDAGRKLHFARLPMVDDGEGSAMQVVVIRYDPDSEVPVHYHETDYCSIVVKGEIEITRRHHGVGSVRLVKAGTAYGPLRIGPEGCTVIDIFATGTPDPTKNPRLIPL